MFHCMLRVSVPIQPSHLQESTVPLTTLTAVRLSKPKQIQPVFLTKQDEDLARTIATASRCSRRPCGELPSGQLSSADLEPATI